MGKKMIKAKDRKFKNRETGKVFSSYQAGLENFNKGYDEQVREGVFPANAKRGFPPDEELIYNGAIYFEENPDDFEEL